MITNDEIVRYCLKELERIPQKGEEFRYIGITCEAGRATVIKSYHGTGNGTERGSYNGDEGAMTSRLVITKDTPVEQLGGIIKELAERACSNGALFSALSYADSDTWSLESEILENVKTALEYCDNGRNPLFDTGILYSEEGSVKAVKYYLYMAGESGRSVLTLSEAVKRISGGSICFDNGTAGRLKELGYIPTMIGINRFFDSREIKLYFDMGKSDSHTESALELSKRVLVIPTVDVPLTATELEVLYEKGLYLRGVGLDPCDPGKCRLYLDRVTRERPKRKLFC